jgi:hypothetical protein
MPDEIVPEATREQADLDRWVESLLMAKDDARAKVCVQQIESRVVPNGSILPAAVPTVEILTAALPRVSEAAADRMMQLIMFIASGSWDELPVEMRPRWSAAVLKSFRFACDRIFSVPPAAVDIYVDFLMTATLHDQSLKAEVVKILGDGLATHKFPGKLAPIVEQWRQDLIARA